MELTEQDNTNKVVQADLNKQIDVGPNIDLEDELKDAEERGNWSGKLDFLLSCIGYAVGLGNVWRFPYLCFKNGGGAFLLPYIIMLGLSGLPLFFLELAIGQFASQGPITLYKKLNRYFVGLGWAMVVISTLTSIYYNVIIMWSIFYLFASFTPEVPWKHCDPSWASPWCRELKRIEDLNTDFARLEETASRYNTSCLGYTSHRIENTTIGSYDKIAKFLKQENYPAETYIITYSELELHNLPNIPPKLLALNNSGDFSGLGMILPTVLRTPLNISNKNKRVFKDCEKRIEVPSGDYFHRYVLEIQNADGIGFLSIGNIKWQLALTFMITWFVIFVCLVKGVASSGKVVYFTATFPYLVLVALLIRGLTLPGYMEGIKFYIIPEWEKLKDSKVWADAAIQIFYSLGPGFGGLLTFASYNKFHNNCHRDAILVAFINCGTSIFAGFAVFSIIGYMSYSTGLEVSEVPVSGSGLLFIAYPEAIARMPAPTVWAVLFFFMVFTLGLDSQFGMMETVISAIADQFHEQLRTRKELLTFVCCFIGFLCGLPCVTYGGMYVLTVMDNYCASYSLMVVSIFNLIIVTLIYGANNLFKDIEMMIGFKPNIYWRIMWNFVTPLVTLLILIASAVQNVPASYRGYVFPAYVQGLGWVTMAASICLIPIFFIIETFRYPTNLRSLLNEMKEARGWGPALAENRVGYKEKDTKYYDNKAFETEVTQM